MLYSKQVILDTDLGTDIDDTWALAYLLRCKELRPELILTSTGDIRYRSALCMRFLEKANLTDIAVGGGIETNYHNSLAQTLLPCLENFSFEKSPVKWYKDGLSEAIRILELNDETTIIAIAPLTNISKICQLRPDLMSKVRLVAMAGSIKKNFRDAPGKIAEYNITVDIPAAQTVFAAPWKEFVLTPLDHCGDLVIKKDDYRQIASSSDAMAKEIIYQYHTWLKFNQRPSDGLEEESSILYDTAAVHLARTLEDCEYQKMNLKVDDKGYIIESASGKTVNVALRWKDKDAFLHQLSNIISGRYH